MPSLGVAMTEGIVLRWLKAPGDAVVEGEPIVEIETDKTTVEVGSPATGILGPLLVAEGDTVPTGVAMTHVTDGAGAGPTPMAEPVPRPGQSTPTTSAPSTPEPAPAPEPAVPTDADARAPQRLSPRQRRIEREQSAAAAPPAARPVTTPAVPSAPDPSAGTATLLPIDITGLDPTELRRWLRAMLLIRELESRIDALALSGAVPGGAHLSIGQEAVAVGIASALRPADPLTCSHRSHHHALAKGLPTNGVMAELFGRATGVRGGRGGTMHMADLTLGFLGGNGIVGAGVGIAMGAALAAQLRGSGQVAVGIVGEGGANTGRTWEAVNLATVWKLPLIVVCENNRYAVETDSATMTGGGSVSRRAEGFGIRTVTVDGQDVAAMHRATVEARALATAGAGPTFIEAMTYRYEGHSTGQVIRYRTIDEVRAWQETRDPIGRLRLALADAGELTDDTDRALADAVRDQVDAAIAFAEASPLPDPADATRGVTGLDLGWVSR